MKRPGIVEDGVSEPRIHQYGSSLTLDDYACVSDKTNFHCANLRDLLFSMAISRARAVEAEGIADRSVMYLTGSMVCKLVK